MDHFALTSLQKMDLLRNSIILEKIFTFSTFDTKVNLKKVVDDEGLGGTIAHVIKHANLQYPCHICMLDLSIYYALDCEKFTRYFPDRTVVHEFYSVCYIHYVFELH